MGQLQLFTPAQIAGMRDRTRGRNYAPEREQFRREQARRREVGLARRHAQKLYHLWHHDADPEPLAITATPPTPVAAVVVKTVAPVAAAAHTGSARQARPRAAARPHAATVLIAEEEYARWCDSVPPARTDRASAGQNQPT